MLRPEAHREYGGSDVDFDKDSKISYLKAWTIESNGHEIAVGDKDAVEHGYLEDIEYTDVRGKAPQFPEANPGSVVGYEYVQRDRPYVFEDNWWFQDPSPVVTARFKLQLPAGWEFTARWFNFTRANASKLRANQYVWEVNDIPAIDVEPDMPALDRGRVGGLKYFPHDPAMRAKTTDHGTIWDSGMRDSRRPAAPLRRKSNRKSRSSPPG